MAASLSDCELWHPCLCLPMHLIELLGEWSKIVVKGFSSSYCKIVQNNSIVVTKATLNGVIETLYYKTYTQR